MKKKKEKSSEARVESGGNVAIKKKIMGMKD